MNLLRVSLSATLLALALPAQNNLLGNAGFESPSLAPWTVRSSVGSLQTSVVPNAAVGANDDHAFQIQFDSTSPSLYELVQTVQLPATGWYQLSLSGRRISGNGSVLLGVGSAATNWTWGPGGVNRNHYVSVGQPVLLSKGSYTCSLYLRNNPGSKFTAQLDELVVRQLQMPGMIFDDTRIYAYDATVRHFLVAYASLQRLSTPITLPGWNGGFDLDPFRQGGLIFVGIGISDPGRPATLVLLPQSVNTIGRTLFFQPIDLTGQSFGSRLALRWRP